MALKRLTELAALGLSYDPTRCFFHIEDFGDEYAAGPLTGTSPWIATLLSSGTAETSGDGNIGGLVLSGAATTDNSGAQVQADKENVTLQNGKDAVFGVYFKASQATDIHLLKGFGEIQTTILDGADGIACNTLADSVAFFKPDNATTWYIVAKSTAGGVVLNSAIPFTFVADTYYWMEFVVHMTSATAGVISVYVDRLWVGDYPLVNGPITDMSASLALVSGTASGTISETIRKVYYAVEY